MLKDLKILNGELSPLFDINNDTYTVFVNNDVTHLEISYSVSESSNVNIYGNDNLVVGENIVIIEITNTDGDISSYNLLVTREEEQRVSNFEVASDVIEVKKELPTYVAPVIASICFLLILISFAIIFKSKKHKIK